MRKSYYVKAIWDEEAQVFYSRSNIPGLNIEAATLHEFVEIAEDLAPQMLEANVAPDKRNKPGTPSLKGLELAFV
jgi:hypothetical protein